MNFSTSTSESQLKKFTVWSNRRYSKETQNWDKDVIRKKCRNVSDRLTTEMNDKGKHFVDRLTLAVVSNWLTLLSITEFGFE